MEYESSQSKKKQRYEKKNSVVRINRNFRPLFRNDSICPDYETDFEVKSLVVRTEPHPVTFPIEGKSVAEVQTNVDFKNWTATSNAEWLKVEKQEKQVVISRDERCLYPRVGNVTIAYGHQSYTIDVLEPGKLPACWLTGRRARCTGRFRPEIPPSR